VITDFVELMLTLLYSLQLAVTGDNLACIACKFQCLFSTHLAHLRRADIMQMPLNAIKSVNMRHQCQAYIKAKLLTLCRSKHTPPQEIKDVE
jgi:hypothetical protein